MWVYSNMQTLTWHHELLLILEASGQLAPNSQPSTTVWAAFLGTWLTTMSHFQIALSLDHWHCLPPQGFTLVSEYDGHEQHCPGSTLRPEWLEIASSPGSLLKNGEGGEERAWEHLQKKLSTSGALLWRYQSDCRTKLRVHVTFCPLSKKIVNSKWTFKPRQHLERW